MRPPLWNGYFAAPLEAPQRLFSAAEFQRAAPSSPLSPRHTQTDWRKWRAAA